LSGGKSDPHALSSTCLGRMHRLHAFHSPQGTLNQHNNDVADLQ
jgi:hypothetical protein